MIFINSSGEFERRVDLLLENETVGDVTARRGRERERGLEFD
ncbi:hypothetical protein [Haladaptatus sp. W1]|nr:hypothetical protein [Haladaptatus sp. W1]